MSYAVIGSNCFTGSHIVDALLAQGAKQVVGISRSPEKTRLYLPYKQRPSAGFHFEQIDMAREPERLIEFLDDLRPTVVINSAALSEVNQSNFTPLEYYETNTLSLVKLANQLRERKYLKRFVQISSAEVYGSCSGRVTEDNPFRPSTPYAVSKAAADWHLMTLHKNFGFPVNFIRSTNVYGRYQQLFKIIPRCMIYIKQGKRIRLEGGGKAVKHFVHIRDVVRGVLDTIERGIPGEAYNFSTENDRSVADIVSSIAIIMGTTLGACSEVVGDRLGQDDQYWLDCSKANQGLGWEPIEDYEKSLHDVAEWISAEWDAIQREPLEYIHTV